MEWELTMDPGAAYIVSKLEKAGFEAYVVGGCVRDAQMGLIPKDWDITTSARPPQIKALFPKTFDTGIEHGTISVLWEKRTYEVTTYRIDGQYSDHRRPDTVCFTSRLYEDLARRDFTINAMAYHPVKGLIDYFNGCLDIKKRRIRCVGNAAERFEEDALRMLRAIRFAVRLRFTIEEETRKAIIEKAPLLQYVSKERIADELTKTLLCQDCSGLEEVGSTGLCPWISPRLGKISPDFEAPRRVAPEKGLRWAAFLHPLGSSQARAVLSELKFDTATIRRATHLLEFLRAAMPQEDRAMRFFLYELGTDDFMALCQLKRATGLLSEEEERQMAALFERQKEACVTLKQLAVSGRDLLAAGAKTGKELGETLEKLLCVVMEEPQMNQRDRLLAYFREHLKA